MSAQPLVTIIIPVYNQLELLTRCLNSVSGQVGVQVEILVIDDGSPRDPAAVLSGQDAIRLIRCGRNLGYAAANNLGLFVAQGDYLMFLNSDTELEPVGLLHLVSYLQDNLDVAGVAPLHREPTGTYQRTCYKFPTLHTGFIWDSVIHERRPHHPVCDDYTMADWDHLSARCVEHAQTSCLLIRRSVYDLIGGMDEQFRLFYNDTDFCRRMYAAGHKIMFLPSVEILHHGGASVRTFDGVNNRIYIDRYRYFRKWFGWRGGLAVRSALWSRVLYHGIAELTSGRVIAAARRFARGAHLQHILGRSQ